MLDFGSYSIMGMKAAIYDPYLDTLGGGERYCLTVGEILLKHGYSVDMFWSGEQDLLTRAVSRFSLKLDGIRFVPDLFGLVHQNLELIEEISPSDKIISAKKSIGLIDRVKKFQKKYTVLKDYDLLFYLSDGSFPFLFAKKNIFHIQVPFSRQTEKHHRLTGLLKNRFVNQIVCNSRFTSSFIPEYLKSKTTVLYPPVSVEDFASSDHKSNHILSVGRFDNILNSKKQDLLISVFADFIKQNPKSDWKLILAGGSRLNQADNHYLLHLKSLAASLPVEFVINPDFNQLKDIYSQAKIYWHAAGFGVDETNHPEETEHFGIAPVEAMASGAVPLLINKGGLKELVTDGVDGYLWDTPADLLAKTQVLINTPKSLSQLSSKAKESADRFSKSIFETKLMDILKLK